MSRSKLILLMALVLLVAVPVGPAFAQQPTLISAGEAALEGEGTAVIWDDMALSDAVTITMTGVTPPATGTVYEGWLVSDDGSVKLSLGILAVGGLGSIGHSFDSSSTGYTGENLIQNYDKAVITVEPAADPDPGPTSAVAFSAQIPAGAMAHIRHLVADWPPGSGVGILTNLQTVLNGSIRHANLARNSDTLELVRLHTHHVINAIEGEGGANFDASFGDPAGDGIGVLGHAADRKHAGFAAGAAVENLTIAAQAELVEANGSGAAEQAELARDQALTVLTTSLNIANILLGPGGRTVITSLEESLRLAGLAYVEAQRMATYELQAGTVTTVAAPGTVGEPTIPLLAQMALIASLMFLGAGGIMVLRGRRSQA